MVPVLVLLGVQATLALALSSEAARRRHEGRAVLCYCSLSLPQTKHVQLLICTELKDEFGVIILAHYVTKPARNNSLGSVYCDEN
mgnify:CR=1 FL=1